MVGNASLTSFLCVRTLLKQQRSCGSAGWYCLVCSILYMCTAGQHPPLPHLHCVDMYSRRRVHEYSVSMHSRLHMDVDNGILGEVHPLGEGYTARSSCIHEVLLLSVCAARDGGCHGAPSSCTYKITIHNDT